MTDILDRIGDQLELAEHELWRAAESTRSARRPRVSARRRKLLRRPVLLAIVLIGASASVGGLALAGVFDGAIGPQAWLEGQRVQPEPAMTPDQTADLEIMRRARVPSDALPAGMVQDATHSPTAGFGPNPQLSRRAQGLPAGAAWLIPGYGTICLEARYPVAGGGGGCDTSAEVNAGQMWILGFSQAAPHLLGIAGVAPDGANTVTITTADGSTQSLTVHDNVYMTEIPSTAGTFTIKFTGPSGPVTLTSSNPVLPGATSVTAVP